MAECNIISSNCVIWQGVDIPCIDVCTGDTITDVIADLATKLCDTIEVLDITTVDLDCFNLPEADVPTNLTELLDLIVTRICANTGGDTPTPTVDCPECMTTLEVCFQYTDDEGNLVTELPLREYAILIATRVCTIIDDITTIQLDIANHEGRITTLENAVPPTYVLPDLDTSCLSVQNTLRLDLLTAALRDAYCDLVSATGRSTTIVTAVAHQCPDLATDVQLANPTETMSDLTDWDTDPVTLADSFTNMWLTICDLRAAVRNIQLECCPGGCNAIDFDVTAVLSGNDEVILTFSGVPDSFVDGPTGSNIALSSEASSANPLTLGVNIKADHIDPGLGLTLSLGGIDPALGNTICTVSHSFVDTVSGLTCNGQAVVTIPRLDVCPTSYNVSATTTTLTITAPWTLGTGYLITASITNIGATQTQTFLLTDTTLTATFTALNANTIYYFEITTDGSICDNITGTTSAITCVAPTLGIIDNTELEPKGDTTGLNIEAWQTEYDANNP